MKVYRVCDTHLKSWQPLPPPLASHSRILEPADCVQQEIANIAATNNVFKTAKYSSQKEVREISVWCGKQCL